MTLTVNVIDRCGPSNNVLPVTATGDKGKAIIAVYIAVKTFYQPFITN